MDENKEETNTNINQDDQYIDKELDLKVRQFYEEHKNETPDEWARSLSYFVTPTIAIILSLFFIFMQRPTLLMILLILSMNLLYTLFNVLSWYNQRIFLYSDRLEYHYGLWKEKIQVFNFGTDDMVAVKSGDRLNMMQKRLDYGSFYIINKSNMAFELKRIGNPDGLLDFVTNKVYEFHKNFDPNYEIPPKEVITKKGTYIESNDGELIQKNKT